MSKAIAEDYNKLEELIEENKRISKQLAGIIKKKETEVNSKFILLMNELMK